MADRVYSVAHKVGLGGAFGKSLNVSAPNQYEAARMYCEANRLSVPVPHARGIYRATLNHTSRVNTVFIVVAQPGPTSAG